MKKLVERTSIHFKKYLKIYLYIIILLLLITTTFFITKTIFIPKIVVDNSNLCDCEMQCESINNVNENNNVDNNTSNNNDECIPNTEEHSYDSNYYDMVITDDNESATLDKIKALFTADERAAGETSRTNTVDIEDGKVYVKNIVSNKKTFYNDINNAKKVVSVDTGLTCDGTYQLTAVLTTTGDLYVNRIASNSYHNPSKTNFEPPKDEDIEYKMYFEKIFTYDEEITDIKSGTDKNENGCDNRYIVATNKSGKTKTIKFSRVNLFDGIDAYIYLYLR